MVDSDSNARVRRRDARRSGGWRRHQDLGDVQVFEMVRRLGAERGSVGWSGGRPQRAGGGVLGGGGRMRMARWGRGRQVRAQLGRLGQASAGAGHDFRQEQGSRPLRVSGEQPAASSQSEQGQQRAVGARPAAAPTIRRMQGERGRVLTAAALVDRAGAETINERFRSGAPITAYGHWKPPSNSENSPGGTPSWAGPKLESRRTVNRGAPEMQEQREGKASLQSQLPARQACRVNCQRGKLAESTVSEASLQSQLSARLKTSVMGRATNVMGEERQKGVSVKRATRDWPMTGMGQGAARDWPMAGLGDGDEGLVNGNGNGNGSSNGNGHRQRQRAEGNGPRAKNTTAVLVNGNGNGSGNGNGHPNPNPSPKRNRNPTSCSSTASEVSLRDARCWANRRMNPRRPQPSLLGVGFDRLG
ncbi:hypothetical protein PMIN01_10206 [Paraphaeosphaeria minitans]|uniref:Uncharacterized protein n=1 Tax=Paraphaeosphaeria minitans TaxID=565426 RepID=A0A9P6KMS5_9PLEO|nr:hypothetical protein PMIN01_10206 [Paraphaeosphaeria minitans]